jgi:hypothetical protein
MLTRAEIVCMIKHDFVESQIRSSIVLGGLLRVERNGIQTVVRANGSKYANRIGLKRGSMLAGNFKRVQCYVTCP